MSLLGHRETELVWISFSAAGMTRVTLRPVLLGGETTELRGAARRRQRWVDP